MPELAILIGPPGAGKSTFHRAQLAGTHAHVSNDALPRRRPRPAAQQALAAQALAAGRSVTVDNVNATAAERAPWIALGRRHGATIVGYVLATPAGECARRNRARAAPDRVPDAAVFAAAKRLEAPRPAEGFEGLLQVVAEGGRFTVTPAAPHTVFLLSPASTSGERAALLLRPGAGSEMARRLQSPAGAPLGDVFAFLSALYFRGKLAYARRFGRPPPGLCGAFVITPGEGLRDPAEPVTAARLRRYVEVPIRPDERRYREPLRRDAAALAHLAGEDTRIVLLGSIATPRYVAPLLEVFGPRLLFPPAFVGRGDMSRGGLLLRCVEAGRELDYAPVAGAVVTGPRPPRLPRRSPSARRTAT